MKLFMALIFSACFIACYSQEEIKNDREVVFTSVNVVPMDADRVLMNQAVVIKNGKIQAIGDAKKIKYGKNALVIDGAGKYLMPGLAEMHAHVPPVDDLEPMKDVLLLFATHGVTTIRGMLGHSRHLELRSKVQSGEIFGPRFITSGPSLSGQTIKSPAEAEKMVKEQKKAGYDFLKIHPGLTSENFEALAKTAKQENIPFAGHVSFDVGVWRAIDAKYQTIDHMDAFIEGLVPGIENMKEEETGLFGMFVADRADTMKIPALIKALRENNVWVVPTQALAERWFTPARDAASLKADPEMKYMNQKTLDNWVQAKTNLAANPKYDPVKMDAFIKLRGKLIYECNKNGVGLLLGSDAPQIFNVPGMSTHHELQYLVDAGLSPYEALKTGTANVGVFYNRPGEMGVIKPGAISDLILVEGNPLSDISNSKNIEGVMLGNKWLSKSEIEKILEKLEK